jgi:transcriptional regulator with PAS, ATPase and Fis domain
MEMQSKLLRVLQERELNRVGSSKRIKLDVRFVAATNHNLAERVEKGEFRRDLFFRLNSGRIQIPPLRQQTTAIKHLAQLIIAHIAELKSSSFRYISHDARKILEVYQWPGNIRELHNVLERVLLLNNEETLSSEHLAFLGTEAGIPSKAVTPLSSETIILPEESLDLEVIVNVIIRKALKKFNNNKTQTAKYLCMSRGALRNKIANL